MPQFEKITDVKAQYNENLLPIDFLNDNNHPWTATLAGGTITAGPQTDIYYAKKGIRIQASGTDLNDSFFALADQNHYSFTVPKSGDYIFQFAAYSNCPNNSPVEINGWLNIIEVAIPTNVTPPLLQNLEFKIGNNSEPEFSFNYRKFEHFFIPITLEEGKTYFMEWNIGKDVSAVFDWFDLTLDLFKLESMIGKTFNIPTTYTKPGQ